jgi:lipopolysaccharide export LptBFGC system permease protein LptF
MASRAARARAYLLTLVAYVAYYVVERAFENWGADGRLAPLIAGQAPNLLFRAAGLVAFLRLTRRGWWPECSDRTS